MGKESVQKFYELLRQDAAIVEELKAIVEGVDSAEKATAVLIDFAKNKGFDFTAEDIAEFEAENQRELSLEELDNINAAGVTVCFLIGGGKGNYGDYGLGASCCGEGWGLGIGVTWFSTREEGWYKKKKDKE